MTTKKAERIVNQFLESVQENLNKEMGSLYHAILSSIIGPPPAIAIEKVGSPSVVYYDEDAAEEGCVGMVVNAKVLVQCKVPPRLDILETKLNNAYERLIAQRIPDAEGGELDLPNCQVEVSFSPDNNCHLDLELVFHLRWI